MNRLLANALAMLNALFAIIIVVLAARLGYDWMEDSFFGAAIGVIVGVAIASLACGTIAFLALIEGHLAVLASRTERQRQSRQPRRDPEL